MAGGAAPAGFTRHIATSVEHTFDALARTPALVLLPTPRVCAFVSNMIQRLAFVASREFLSTEVSPLLFCLAPGIKRSCSIQLVVRVPILRKGPFLCTDTPMASICSLGPRYATQDEGDVLPPAPSGRALWDEEIEIQDKEGQETVEIALLLDMSHK